MSLLDEVAVIAPYGGASSAPPTRDQLIAVQTTGMQGLTLDGQPFLDWYLTTPDWDAAKRQRAYDLKHAAGDTHCLLALSWNYQEAGAFAPTGFDGTQDWDRFLAIMDEVIAAGFMVSLHLAGDGLSTSGAAPWRYNDPQGWTYGWQWLMANIPDIRARIGDARAAFIVWCDGFDGCVPGWAGLENDWHRTNEWLERARQVLGPSAVIAIYLSAGYWAWSGETNDYATPDGQNVDVVYYEGPWPWGSNWDQLWQISKRLLDSMYRRPADQPADDDPGTVPGLHTTPRGLLSEVFLEYDTYGWVRGRVDAATVQQHRDYIRGMGWQHVG